MYSYLVKAVPSVIPALRVLLLATTFNSNAVCAYFGLRWPWPCISANVGGQTFPCTTPQQQRGSVYVYSGLPVDVVIRCATEKFVLCGSLYLRHKYIGGVHVNYAGGWRIQGTITNAGKCSSTPTGTRPPRWEGLQLPRPHVPNNFDDTTWAAIWKVSGPYVDSLLNNSLVMFETNRIHYVSYCQFHVVQDDPCDPSPCQNGGQCLRNGTDFYCVNCALGFSGKACHIDDPCVPSPCKNRGQCVRNGNDYYCVNCADGWSGKRCHIGLVPVFTLCPLGFAHGQSTEVVCQPNRHQNECADEESKIEFVYTDDRGTSTSLCSYNFSSEEVCPATPPVVSSQCPTCSCSCWDSNFLKLTFIVNKTLDHGKTFECRVSCASGSPSRTLIQGCRDIQVSSDGPCEPSRCLNGARCVKDGSDYYCTDCPFGWSGRNCHIESDQVSTACPHGFVHNELATVFSKTSRFNTVCAGQPSMFQCVFIDVMGYSSLACFFLFPHDDACPARAPVINNRECPSCNCSCTDTDVVKVTFIANKTLHDGKTFKCQLICGSGAPVTELHGCQDIQVASDSPCNPNPCHNGATCSPNGTHYSCGVCPDGWVGRKCHIDDPCDPSPCQNGARCIRHGADYSCDCPAGWIGKNCNIDDLCVPNHCQNNASCIHLHGDYSCRCLNGWVSKHCNIVDPCDPSPCQNDAYCIQEGADYSCGCPVGWSGKKCHLDDPCDPSPCQNGGQCQQQAADYFCDCVNGWRGKNCHIGDPCDPSPCQNGATCIRNGTDYSCGVCPDGWSGKKCHIGNTPVVTWCPDRFEDNRTVTIACGTFRHQSVCADQLTMAQMIYTDDDKTVSLCYFAFPKENVCPPPVVSGHCPSCACSCSENDFLKVTFIANKTLHEGTTFTCHVACSSNTLQAKTSSTCQNIRVAGALLI